MSSEYLAQVWYCALPTTEKLLYAYLADSCDHGGGVPELSTAHLAGIISRNTKTTNKALRELETRGLLSRVADPWSVIMMDGARHEGEIDAELERIHGERGPVESPALQKSTEPAKPDKPAPVAPSEPAGDGIADDTEALQALVDQEAPAPSVRRLLDFAGAWGLDDIDDELEAAWSTLEAAEAKFNRTEKHSDDERKWTVEIESLEELLPAILVGARVFKDRAEQGLPNHAANAVEFLNMQLWLAPDYQRETPSEFAQVSEAELNDMVMTMNRKGGPFKTHLRTSGINPHTKELETETLKVYQSRVMAKWNQYQAASDYFTE